MDSRLSVQRRADGERSARLGGLHGAGARSTAGPLLEHTDTREKEAMIELLHGKVCPHCGSEHYYWLKSSGRCSACGFHWGLDPVAEWIEAAERRDASQPGPDQ